MKGGVMGGTCGTYGGEKQLRQEFCGETWRREYLEDLVVDGRIILKCIFKQ